MTRDDIILMAQEANRYANDQTGDSYEWHFIRDDRFAALVAAAEREACAKVCEALNFVDNGTPAGTRASNRHCAAAIRARGAK